MNSARQARLVAAREIRERSRSRAFRASLVVMILAVAGVILLPALLDISGGTRDIGLTGSVPTELAGAIQTQGDAVDTQARVHRYESLAAGEDAVRAGDIDVLVVDGQRLEWRRHADEQLRAVVTAAIQRVAIQDRAAAAGISPDKLLTLVAPVPVDNVELGQVEGRSPDDETAAFIMTVVLFISIATYGAMALSGVVEEKSSRVVEVLLARMPARSLLAGKVAGIGLLGLAQIGLTALVALVAATMTDSIDIPAVRGAVLAWVVVWFVLGYALYATVFGAIGSLASRPEDAQSVAGPVSVVLIAGYFVSFAAIGSPDSAWAKVVSFLPATAPLAMPNRIAMGAATWWEPVVSAALTLTAIAGLVQFGGRVYTGGILHTGPTLKFRDAWRGTTTPGHTPADTGTPPRHTIRQSADAKAQDTRSVTPPGGVAGPLTNGVLVGIAVGIAAAVFMLVEDAVVGIAAGAGFYAIANRTVKARTGRNDRDHSRRE